MLFRGMLQRGWSATAMLSKLTGIFLIVSSLHATGSGMVWGFVIAKIYYKRKVRRTLVED